jgi:hypothetical protein
MATRQDSQLGKAPPFQFQHSNQQTSRGSQSVDVAAIKPAACFGKFHASGVYFFASQAPWSLIHRNRKCKRTGTSYCLAADARGFAASSAARSLS